MSGEKKEKKQALLFRMKEKIFKKGTYMGSFATQGKFQRFLIKPPSQIKQPINYNLDFQAARVAFRISKLSAVKSNEIIRQLLKNLC